MLLLTWRQATTVPIPSQSPAYICASRFSAYFAAPLYDLTLYWRASPCARRGDRDPKDSSPPNDAMDFPKTPPLK